MRRWFFVVVGAAAIATATPATAQICAGRQAFGYAPLQATGEAAFTGDGPRVGIALAGGGDGLFGGALVSLDDRSSPSHVSLGALLGTDQPLSVDNRFHGCPAVIVQHTNEGWGAPARRLRVSAALNAGMLLRNAPHIAVVPTIGLTLHHQRESGGHTTFGALTAGLGIVFTRGIAVGPMLEIPVGPSPDSLSFIAAASFALR
jgi:hypothetical protein